MKRVLIKNGILLSPINHLFQVKHDILIENGVIQSISKNLEGNAEIIDAEGCLVTPGLIDIHVHCYPVSQIGMQPDTLGIERGATTIIDAGTSGAYNFEDFKNRFIDTAKTKVYSLLNVSSRGLEVKHELDEMSKIDEKAIHEIIKKYPKIIVGLKARASASVIGQMGIRPIALAAEIGQKENLPLVVHVGNYPPALGEVLNILHKGDIATHAYHGKSGGILDEQGEVITEAIEARKRDVLFDIGHGVASFSFKVFQNAFAKGFDCDLISTDLHIENFEGPVHNLAAVLSKMINCGESLENAISKSTSTPARLFGLKGLGELKEGFVGDLSILRLEECNDLVEDSIHDTLVLKRKLTLCQTVYSKEGNSEIFRHNTK